LGMDYCKKSKLGCTSKQNSNSTVPNEQKEVPVNLYF
jgi:hypothetical protein